MKENDGCGLNQLIATLRVLWKAVILTVVAGLFFDRVFWFVSARGSKRGVGSAVLGLIGKGRRHGELDAAHAGPHQRTDLQELKADGAARGAGELGVLEADATQGADQDTGHWREPQAQLVGAHGVGRGAVGIKIELAFLDAVFGLPSGAIDLLVEMVGRVFLAPQRGDDKARVGRAASPFRFGDDPTRAAPALAFCHVKSLKRRADRPLFWLCSAAAASSASISPTSRLFFARPNKKLIPYSHTMPSAPRGQNPKSARSKMRTRGQRWRMRATTRAISSTLPALASMLAGRSLATNKCRPPEHIERQVAVIVVIAVEETLFLMPVQWVVGGVEVEGDLRRRRMGIEKQVDKQGFDRRRVIADLMIADRLQPAQFQPVERRLADQRRAIRTLCFKLAAHRHDRVMAHWS